MCNVSALLATTNKLLSSEQHRQSVSSDLVKRAMGLLKDSCAYDLV